VPAGGHNLLEPAQMGCPVVYGPCTANVVEAAARLEESGAGRRIADAAELASVLAEVLADPATARARVTAADLAACTKPLEQTLQLASSLLVGAAGAVGSR
jgi:3-deoxy-D-manno-octulosonic-acid transferase